MKLTRQDWRLLRTPIISLGVAIILMTLLVSYTQSRKDTAQQALQSQQSQLNQARQRYQTSGQEKETIAKYLPVYQQLIANGFIGEERRIEWVDTLRNIHQQNKLFTINYSIGTQEEYKPMFALNAGPFSLHRSLMKLELAMLHEGDLLTLLQSLSAQQTAPFILRQCEIKRVGEIKTTALTANMLATCELDWLTIREPQVEGTITP